MAKPLKQALILTLKIALAAGLIYWFIANGSLDLNLISSIITPERAVLIVLLVGSQVFINTYRWQLLMAAQGLLAKAKQTIPLSLIGIFFNYAMPGGVGGDVVKGYYLIQDRPQSKGPVIISIFMDRMVGFFIMILTAALALIWKWETAVQNDALKSLAVGVLVLAFAFVLFFAFALSRRFKNYKFIQFLFEKLPMGRKIESVYDRLHTYRKDLPTLWKAFALSFVAQVGPIIAVYLIGSWVGVTELSFGDYMFLVPLGTVATALPISPAGIGVGQAAFYFLFNSALGYKSPLGPIAITALQVALFFWGLIGAVFYLRRSPVRLQNAS